ncbi:MAG TPA: hypothetical protein VN156_10430 [Pseudomonas sp.]|nr:hypothetical protein [Pseudomonas sp.]
MQKTTQAYADDPLALLELQLQKLAELKAKDRGCRDTVLLRLRARARARRHRPEQAGPLFEQHSRQLRWN